MNPEPMDEAMAALRAGDTVRAETLALEAVRRVAEQSGVEGAAYASVQCDLGNIFLQVGSEERALVAMQKACAYIPGADETEAVRNRLTYLMNLGTLLGRLHRLEEAESALREGVTGRRAFYGEGHAGYGFGTEPLADLLAARGKLDEALALAEATVVNFESARHIRVATALAVRAEIRKRVRADAPVFDDFAGLPDEMLIELARAVIARGSGHDARAALGVLVELRALLAGRLGTFHPTMIEVLKATTNVARAASDTAVREGAFAELVQLFDTMGAAEQALECALGLALARSEARGREREALEAYASALVRARSLGSEAISNVRRNLGLYHAELGNRPDAEKELRAAVDDARAVQHVGAGARASCALGIFLQHGGDLEGAREHLEAAIRGLPMGDADAVCARSHLDAVVSSGSCGCGNTRKALAAELRAMVEPELPEGLLGSLELGDGGKLSVTLTRVVSAEEAEQVERVVRHARAALGR